RSRRISRVGFGHALYRILRHEAADHDRDRPCFFCCESTSAGGAILRQARVSALLSVAGSAFASNTLVLPPLPHPPGTGRKISGSASTSMVCCSGVSFTILQASSG